VPFALIGRQLAERLQLFGDETRFAEQCNAQRIEGIQRGGIFDLT